MEGDRGTGGTGDGRRKTRKGGKRDLNEGLKRDRNSKRKAFVISLLLMIHSKNMKPLTLFDFPGFSVAFGSTGCSGSAGGRVPFAPLARTLSAGGMNS